MSAVNTQVIEAHIRISLTNPKIVLSVTDGIYELLGFKADDFLTGQVTLESLINAHDQDIANELFSTEIKSTSSRFNIRLRQANGRIRCLSGYYTKVIDDTYDIVILELLLQDAKSLWQQQGDQTVMANFNAMMENTNDYIYFKDSNHVFTGASQTLVAITDPSEHWSDLLGKTDYDVFPEVYADNYYNLEKQVFAGIKVAHEVQEILDNQGNKGWVDNRKYPIRNEEGKIIGLFGIARDITENKKLEDSKQAALALLSKIAHQVPGVVYQYRLSPDGHASYPFASEGIRTIYRLCPEEVREDDSKVLRIIHPDDLTEFVISIQKSAQELTLWHHEYRVKFDHNTVHWLLGSAMPVKEEDGSVLWHGFITDITERKQAELNLQIAATVFESQEGMLVTDVNGTILRVNSAFTKITGYSAEEAIGNNPSLLKSFYHDADFYISLWKSIIDTGFYEGELWNRHKNGQIYPEQLSITAVKDNAGKITNFVATFKDISARKAIEARVSFLANHDRLTELPNRELFYDRLSQAISQARRKAEGIALLYLDLDGFKPINDTYGHEAGDNVLKVVAKRLQSCVREMDTVARMGGDEFAVILSSLQNPVDVKVIAQKIIHKISEVIELDTTKTCIVGISIGIAIYPDNGSEINKLMNAADSAMYASKEAGRNTYTISIRQNNQHESYKAWISLDEFPLLGVQVIDSQHLKIVDMINDLNEAIKHTESLEQIDQLLEELIKFTSFHFKTEERLMHEYGYLQEIEHQNEHEHLLNEIAYLKTQFMQGGELVLLQKLKDWFHTHIVSSDKNLADFIIQHNAK